ncbi:MAG: 8-amino-7-oxononanoate synthase, partial [Paramuribaculum sp.]|nr:8-amino-7-oxononanoate synthase [Paramuribaculum sp.]
MESIEESLGRLARNGNLRVIPPDSSDDGLVDFTSNDYLGLAADRGLQDEFFRHLSGRRPSLTASASRLLASDQASFGRLEETLGRMYGRKALLFNSGYHANTGLISSL